MKKIFFTFILIFLFQYFFYVKGCQVLYIFNKVIFVIISLITTYIFTLFFLKKGKLYPYTIYILSWFLILLFSSTISSYIHFGQPIIYGLTAEIKIYAIMFYFLVLLILNKCKFSYKTIENIFVRLGILSLLVFFIVAIFFKFSLKNTEFLKYDPVRGWRLNLPFSIITIISFYYWQKFLLKKRLKYSLFPIAAIFFLIYFEKSRMITTGILFIIIFNFFSSKNIKLISKVISFLLLVALLSYISSKINYNNLIFHSSLSIRLISIKKAIYFIKNRDLFVNILIGVGGLNPVLFKPIQNFFGRNFWPSDIGLLGIFFEFGITGIIFVLTLWMFILKEVKKNKILSKNSSILVTAFEDYIYLSILLSPLVPIIIYNLGIFSSILGMLVYLNYFYYRNKIKQQEVSCGKIKSIYTYS